MVTFYSAWWIWAWSKWLLVGVRLDAATSLTSKGRPINRGLPSNGDLPGGETSHRSCVTSSGPSDDAPRPSARPLADEAVEAPAAPEDRLMARRVDPAAALKAACAPSHATGNVIHSYSVPITRVKSRSRRVWHNLDVGDYSVHVEVPTEEVTEISLPSQAGQSQGGCRLHPGAEWTCPTTRGPRCVHPGRPPIRRRDVSAPRRLMLDDVVSACFHRLAKKAGARAPLAPPPPAVELVASVYRGH